MGGGHHPHVDAPGRAAAEAGHLALLEHPQERRLAGRRELATSSRKRVPPSASSNVPARPCLRPPVKVPGS